jgi:hypothetical protein
MKRAYSFGEGKIVKIWKKKGIQLNYFSKRGSPSLCINRSIRPFLLLYYRFLHLLQLMDHKGSPHGSTKQK